MERKPTRYAHADGHTDVCYSEDGKHLVTCGTDGDIRIWSGFNDDDPKQACIGDWALCVRQKGENIYVATDNNNVQIVTLSEAERTGILVRFTAHVNHVAVGKNHNFIALAAEDMEVRVMDLETKENIFIYSEFTGPPLSVALSSNAKMLAASSGDGFLRVWEIETKRLVKEINCVPKINSFMNAKLLCRIDFEPGSGRHLAYPVDNKVEIINTSDWESKSSLSCSEITVGFSIVQYSPCGTLLAAASEQGHVVLWHVAVSQVLSFTKHFQEVAVCSMVWNPKGTGEIAYCDIQGQLGLIQKCVYSPETKEKATEENDVDFSEFTFEPQDDDDEDDENVVSLEKLKNEVMGTHEPELDFDQESSRPSTPRVIIPEIPLQDAFVPTSTPKHLNPRYMCWNEVGIIRSYGNIEDEEGLKSIEVEFHDASLHNSMMMQNFQNYTMGSLSTSALVVGNGSQVMVIPLSAGTKEWMLNIPEEEEEEIICLASSDKLVGLATSKYMVRLYGIYGTQRAVLSIPGPVVTMSAFGSALLVSYHNSGARKGDQCISIMLVTLEGLSIETKNLEAALCPETTLQWIGFTDLGTPAMQDSYGMVYLYPLSAGVWIPFCDTTKHRKSLSDGFFITAVYESYESVRGIRCRGSVYPGFTPRPVLSELPLAPPFIEMGTEKSQLEANLFTWSTLRVENVEKKFKETALKAFALACKNNLEQRALELIDMINNPQLVTLATKYATKLNKRRLAEKLQELASTLISENEDDNFSSQSVSATPTNIITPNRKLLLPSLKKNKTKKTEEVEETNSESQPAPSNSEQDSILGNSTLNSTVSQDTSIAEPEPKNPFLKSLKKSGQQIHNPLSLTDKFAGFEEIKTKEKHKENSMKNESSEKRKKPDTEADDKKSNKQRKLDKFMFSKRP